jgi:MFS family permease
MKRSAEPGSAAMRASPAAVSRASARDATGLLSGTLLLGLAERLGERFLPIFLEGLGGGAWVVGGYQAGSNFVGALAALPGGVLSDRLGSRRATQLLAALATIGFAVLAWARIWPVAVLGALMALSWSAVSLPSALVLVTRAIPARNTAWGVSMHSLVRRVPMALGPMIAGGLMLAHGDLDGLRRSFVLAAGLGVVAIVVQALLFRGAPGEVPGAGGTAPAFRPLAALRDMSPPLRGLLLADTLVRFCEQIPYAFVVIWCMRVMPGHVDALRFGELTAIEMAVAALSYAPGAWLSTRIGKPVTVAATFVFFTAFPLALLASRSMGMLVVAFVLRGMKELGEPTRKSLILDLCPSEARATHFGWYYCMRDTLAAVAAMLGAWLWLESPAINLVGAALCGLAGTLGYGWRALSIRRRRIEA